MSVRPLLIAALMAKSAAWLGCSSDSQSSGGGGGVAGVGGSAGISGSAGASGSAGISGSAGASGSAGVSGSAGNGGNGGGVDPDLCALEDCTDDAELSASCLEVYEACVGRGHYDWACRIDADETCGL